MLFLLLILFPFAACISIDLWFFKYVQWNPVHDYLIYLFVHVVCHFRVFQQLLVIVLSFQHHSYFC